MIALSNVFCCKIHIITLMREFYVLLQNIIRAGAVSEVLYHIALTVALVCLEGPG